MTQYVYSMHRVGKTVPPKRQILKDISLSFFPGAKIGILGLNGGGKSTLLRIMAGVDTEYRRRSQADGELVDRLSRARTESRPRKNGPRDGRGGADARSSPPASGSTKSTPHTASPTPISTSSPTSKPSSKRCSSRRTATISSSSSKSPPTRLRLPPWDAKIGPLSGGEKRRVALCRLLLSKPDMLLLDEPTNHLDAESVEWLEHFLQRFPGTVVAVTHDRYFLDNAAEWILELDRGRGIPWKGNYSSWLDQKQERLAQEEAARIGAPEGAQARTRVGSRRRQGPAGQEQEPHRALRGTLELRVPAPQRNARDLHPGRGAARRPRHRLRRRAQGLRRPPLMDDVRSRSPPARSSASSAPTAPESRRSSA